MRQCVQITVIVLGLALSSVPIVGAQESRPALTAIDYIEIQQLVSRYAYALDTGADDGYRYADLFAPDGEFIVPYTKGRDALAELARTTAGARGGPDRVWHFLMNHVIEPSPEGATGKEYAAIINIGESGEPSTIQLGGHYEDVYVKTAAGWRFKRREFIPSRSGPRPAATAQAASAAPAAERPPTEMARYYMVFLRRGPAWTAAATPETRAVSRGHMENIERLTKEGKMVVAGPFLEQEGERALTGIFILRVESAAEAKALTESDPAVKAGRFVYEIVPWMGPKGLGY